MMMAAAGLNRSLILQKTMMISKRSFSSSAQTQVHGQMKRSSTGDDDKSFKTYKPITQSLRQLRLPRNDHIYKGRCHLPLTIPLRKNGGRNNTGRITTKHVGGGHKRRLRTIDFMRSKTGPQTVIRIEYDPNRSAHIALISHNRSGTLSYILAPEGLRKGQTVESFRAGIPSSLISSSNVLTQPSSKSDDNLVESEQQQQQEELIKPEKVSKSTLTLGLLRTLTIKNGNVLPIRLIPPGTMIHAISLKPDGKASLIRSAGGFGKLISLGHHRFKKSSTNDDPNNPQSLSSDSGENRNLNLSENDGESGFNGGQNEKGEREGDYAQVKLQSGEIRYIHMNSCATIGSVSNPNWQGRNLGKAGRARWLGKRPRVRGVAMNKVDHPLGGGRGKSKSNKHPVSATGLKSKGFRTRRPGPRGNQMVIKQRPKGKHVGK
ncbi:hypothetical protein BY996DRAFT_6758893 [Phakopsora pachyrhizi]|nr:hypothetical protein BY996DRAFT_6758893 [Phakopsora pachyrhizi]